MQQLLIYQAEAVNVVGAGRRVRFCFPRVPAFTWLSNSDHHLVRPVYAVELNMARRGVFTMEN